MMARQPSRLQRRYCQPMPTAIEALRTPVERFANLPGFACAPHYVDDLAGCAGLRVHYAVVEAALAAFGDG